MLMRNIVRREAARIISNYTRLLFSLIIGIYVTRILLERGEWIFSIYTLITVGMGVSIMLTELIRLGSVPLLGASISGRKVIDGRKFNQDLSAAFAVSLVGALVGAAIMVLLGWLFLKGLGSRELERAAWVFLATRIAMMVVAVALTPAMAVLLVSGRQSAFNFFLFLERLAELVGVAVPLWFLSSESYSEMEQLMQIGAGVAICSIATYIAATFSAFRSRYAVPTRLILFEASTLFVMLRMMAWSSLQIVSSNLYVRVDILIVSAFLGPGATVALGIAIRFLGYVRQATNGLVNGFDAIFANLYGQRRREKEQDDGIEFRLLSLSTSLQGGVVFQLTALLLLLRVTIVNLWVGDIIEGPDAAAMVGDIALLATLMVIGIGFRSLNLGWMSAMTGRGNARHFTPWLMPGAIGNATVLTAWALFAHDTFSIIAVGWVFLGFQLITHGIIIPVVSARSLGCSLRSLIEPLYVPLLIAVATIFIAQGMKTFLNDTSSMWSVLAVITVVFIGFVVSSSISVLCALRD